MLGALVSCSTDQLPVGAVLSISPDSRTYNIVDRRDEQGRCFINPDLYIDEPIVISLRNAEGSPISAKNVSIYADYSGNSFAGPPVLDLYDDQLGNGNGVIDDDLELVGGRGDGVAQIDIDGVEGARVLLLRINVSCPFRGDIFAFINGVTASSVISVSLIAENES